LFLKILTLSLRAFEVISNVFGHAVSMDTNGGTTVKLLNFI